MKIRDITANNRKREFVVTLRGGEKLTFPFAKVDPQPTPQDRIEKLYVDAELGHEAFSYELASGKEGAVHVDQLLEYHQDPKYMAELLSYKLSLEAQRRMNSGKLSRRQVAKQLNTSLPQLYRLLDPANTRKSMNQLIALLHVLDCDVELVVKHKPAA